MLYLPDDIDRYSDDEIQRFVDECEMSFEAECAAIAEELCSNKEFKILGLTGPSCSGKTTAAKKLIANFEKFNKLAHVISVDDFYFDKEIIAENSKKQGENIDFESIKAIDVDLLSRCVTDIFEKGRTFLPRFDFRTGKRSGYYEVEAGENDIFIFEGIQVIYPEVVNLFRKYFFKIVYISAEDSICVKNNIFEPNEIRLLRRIVRDYKYRNSSAEYTLELWKNVRKNEEKNIFPYASLIDYKINSTMTYELCILYPLLCRYLAPIDEKNKYAEFKNAELKKLSCVKPLSTKYISEESVYREFI